MAWTSTFRAGVDIPTWDWLSAFPSGNSSPGTDMAYDGNRYIYALIQYGSTTAASTMALWRYDTTTDGWQFLATTTSGYSGAALEYDPVRNLVYIIHGNLLSSMQVYNPNLTAVSALGQTFNALTLTTTTLTLPATASSGAAIEMSQDTSYTDQILTGTTNAAGSATTLVSAAGTFHAGHVGMAVRLTSGGLSGVRKIISSVSSDGTTATVSVTYGSAPGSGITYVIEHPQGTAAASASTTLVVSASDWTVNQYTNMDVIIVSGPAAGQRRRIASNTANTLTLASAVTGNSRTGAWSTTPGATDTYRIVASSDFLYYTPGNNGTAIYRVDLNTGASATTWSASIATLPGGLGAGGNMHYMRGVAPMYMTFVRGAATNNIYVFSLALLTFTTLTTTQLETLNTGAASILDEDAREILIYKDGAVRGVAYNLSTGLIEPMPTMPYAAPSAYDGHRAVYIKTSQGVKWMYILRAGGTEFFRIPIEW